MNSRKVYMKSTPCPPQHILPPLLPFPDLLRDVKLFPDGLQTERKQWERHTLLGTAAQVKVVTKRGIPALSPSSPEMAAHGGQPVENPTDTEMERPPSSMTHPCPQSFRLGFSTFISAITTQLKPPESEEIQSHEGDQNYPT